MNESSPTLTFNGFVHIVIPVYGEASTTLEATLARLAASRLDPRAHHGLRPVAKIGEAVLSSRHGNAAVFVPPSRGLRASICEVLPAPDWLLPCSRRLCEHPRVAACRTRMVPQNPQRLLSHWRIRLQ
jgi:hypothetical protein